MELFDTHCHIHFPDYGADPEVAVQSAVEAGVSRLLCVGCSLYDSQLAIDFARDHEGVWASVGLHPHEADKYVGNTKALAAFGDLAGRPKVVAVGETGLDYYYGHSTKANQIALLRFQLELATLHNLPLIFHVRDAFADFWKIFDEFCLAGARPHGVVHSFSSGLDDLEQVLSRGLYVGLNGIMTFTKSEDQLAAARAIPLEKLVLETDAPFLTPTPYRGTICMPKHVRVTGEFLCHLRSESFEQLAEATTTNARQLFGL